MFLQELRQAELLLLNPFDGQLRHEAQEGSAVLVGRSVALALLLRLVVVSELYEDVVARLQLVNYRLPASLVDEGLGAPAVLRAVVHADSARVEEFNQRLAPAGFGALAGRLLPHPRLPRAQAPD